jgi:hypothetical protein
VSVPDSQQYEEPAAAAENEAGTIMVVGATGRSAGRSFAGWARWVRCRSPWFVPGGADPYSAAGSP